jgi:5-formyltetrahydrofolate cyclo-ligase
MEALPEAKSVLRGEVLAAMKRVSAAEREAASKLACAQLRAQRIWRDARSILFYAPMAPELDVWPLLREARTAGKVTALPQYDAEEGRYVACSLQDPLTEVHTGRFGIREPVSGCPQIELNRLDLVLVPGVAFDLHGRRLGRGKGHYDQLLCVVRGKTCGVAFDEQIVREVPVEPHDVLLNCILTPTRWIEL